MIDLAFAGERCASRIGVVGVLAGVSGATAQFRIALLNVGAVYLAARWGGRRWLFVTAVLVVSVTVLVADAAAA